MLIMLANANSETCVMYSQLSLLPTIHHMQNERLAGISLYHVTVFQRSLTSKSITIRTCLQLHTSLENRNQYFSDDLLHEHPSFLWSYPAACQVSIHFIYLYFTLENVILL